MVPQKSTALSQVMVCENIVPKISFEDFPKADTSLTNMQYYFKERKDSEWCKGRGCRRTGKISNSRFKEIAKNAFFLI